MKYYFYFGTNEHQKVKKAKTKTVDTNRLNCATNYVTNVCRTIISSTNSRTAKKVSQ